LKQFERSVSSNFVAEEKLSYFNGCVACWSDIKEAS